MVYETTAGFSFFYSDNTNKLNLVPGMYGSIGAYTKNALIYKCPADKSWALISGARQSRVRSYSMNRYVGFQDGVASDYRVVRKSTDFIEPSPSATWLFIDEHEDSINEGCFWSSMNGIGWVDLPSSRHIGGCTLSFADGHVDSKRWLDLRTRKLVERLKLYGLPSPNNPDLLWLMERTTRKIE